MLDCTEMTWEQMSGLIVAVRLETERRNPIGVNFYIPYLTQAEEAILEIAGGEKSNPTSECGPTAAPDDEDDEDEYQDPNDREDGYQLGDDPN